MTRITSTEERPPAFAIGEGARSANDRFGLDVDDFPRFDFCMNDVERAGQVIAGAVPWIPENEPEIRRAFDIAHSWRDAHAYPMKSVRAQIIWYIRDNGLDGKTFARLKRMPAIRKKLRWLNRGLDQIQDLGGCRVIVHSVDVVYKLVEIIRNNTQHTLREPDDYIVKPRKTGCRSYHLLVTFRAHYASSIHDGRRIEVQIRTWLQHSWATAVEAVGLFLGQDLKGGRGDPQWLRFFKLMSASLRSPRGTRSHPMFRRTARFGSPKSNY